MRLGISSYSYGWAAGVLGHMPSVVLTAFDILNRAYENDIKVVQIADNLPLHVLSKSELTKLNDMAKELSICIEVGTRKLDYDNVKRYIKIASFLGSKIIRIVIDDQNYKPSVDEVIRVIKNLVPELKAKDIILAIENHDRFTARQLVEVIKKTDERHIGICLDTVNSLGACEGTEYVVDILAPYTVNLHIKDFEIKRVSHLMGFTVLGTPAGKGNLDIPWLINKISKINPNISAVLELWTPPQSNLEKTISKEYDWVSQSIKYLKNYLD